jgi:hypothetical protein
MYLFQFLLVLHFLGMAMALSASFANFTMLSVMQKAAASERDVLARFPPAMSRVARIGLVLLWITGLTLLYTRWGGFGSVPWQFHVKFTAVVVLTIIVGWIQVLERRIKAGDRAVAAKLPMFGRMAALFALTVIIFAVLAFN